jgi:tRNA-guanine family transglycosylase
MALQFELIAKDGKARAARLNLPARECRTPMFMPVGTQGACASPFAEAQFTSGSKYTPSQDQSKD